METIESLKGNPQCKFTLASLPPLAWQTYDIEYRVGSKDGQPASPGSPSITTASRSTTRPNSQSATCPSRPRANSISRTTATRSTSATSGSCRCPRIGRRISSANHENRNLVHWSSLGNAGRPGPSAAGRDGLWLRHQARRAEVREEYADTTFLADFSGGSLQVLHAVGDSAVARPAPSSSVRGA